MRPRERRESGGQDLFRSRPHPGIKLDPPRGEGAGTIDWGFREEKFGAVYKDGVGQPPLPTRLMAGLAILKHTYNLSDEGGLRAVDREPVLPVLLRGGVFPAPAAAGSLLDDQLAQPHGRGAAAIVVAGEPGGGDQGWRDEAWRSRPRHRRYHGAAEEHYLPDGCQAVEPGP